jgi:ATP-dependent RNA helicase DeaD
MSVEPTEANQSTPLQTTFDAMNLSEPLRRALAEVGYQKPTAVQTAVFGPIANGRDVIVQSKTGSGKTAAFAIPVLDRLVQPEKRVQAMVLCPTRELALQVATEFARLGKHKATATTAIYGGASMSKQIDELQAGAQIVAGTPGRVLDHLRRGTLDVKGLRAIILDEADEMLSMGFAEELNAILEFIPPPGKRQALLFSATMPDSIQRLARRHLREPEFISLSTDNVAPTDITHCVYFVGNASRTTELARILEVEKPEGAIVFCNTKDETEKVSAELQRRGLDADYLNGDLEQASRERVLAALRSGKLQYLVATDVAARGIDISNLSHVINFGFPDSAEQYVHRTGRTGRAGRHGTAISLIGPKDIGNLYMLRLTYGIRPIERTLPSSAEEKTRREVERLNLLREAMTSEPGDEANAVAKRLLTHDDAERFVAFLVGEFFHMATRAAVVQATAPAAAAVPTPSAPEREKPAREPRPAREARPAREGRDEARGRDRREPREARAAREQAESQARPAQPADEKPRRVDVHHVEGGQPAAEYENAEEGMGEIRLAVGRRDGVRAGDIARLVRDKAGLQRRDMGRVFVRDRFTLVSVRDELLDQTLAALKDATLNDVPLAAERGRLSMLPPSGASAESTAVSNIPAPRVPRFDDES